MPRSRLVWSAVSVVALLVSVGVVAGWFLTRPPASAGVDLSTLRAESPATAPSAPSAGAARGDASPGTPPSEASSPSVDSDVEGDALDAPPEPVPPTRIVMAELGVDAVIDPVGVEPDGNMVIPRSPSRVGWYQYGRFPSHPEGNTVLSGHVQTIAEGPGALFRLREAEPGDLITVYDEDGTEHVYEVAGKETLLKQEVPYDEIFARDGRPLLVVVTCGGDFIPGTRRYEDNVIVTAVPVDA